MDKIDRPHTIRTKKAFFTLWEEGLLGNKLRTWRDLAAALASGTCPVGFREVGRAGGGKFEIANRRAEIPDMAARWTTEGRSYMICESAPDSLATIQGEVCRTIGGWAGLLGLVKDGKRMRDSIRDGDLVPVERMQVVDLLDRYMDPPSRDDLEALLDIYPDAVVEFTCYKIKVGFLQRNTIFWEVRNY